MVSLGLAGELPGRDPKPLTQLTLRQLSIGPEAALSLLIGQLIQEVVTDTHHPPKHPEREAAAIALITTFQVSFHPRFTV